MTSFAAAVCESLDGPDALAIRQVEEVQLQPGEVRIRVLAAGINFPDLLMTRGRYQLKPDLPFTPGMEIAGEVMEVGKGAVTAVGARVCASMRFGGFAEQVTVAEPVLRPWPEGFSAQQAAAFYVTAATAWHALVDRAALKSGELLLVLGAGGGVGLAAVQLAKAMGASVVAAARNRSRLDAANRAGAENVVDFSAGSLRGGVEAIYGKRAIDVVFDPVGGEAANEAAACLSWEGRYLVIGFASGQIPAIALNRILLGGYSVIGVRAGESARRDRTSTKENILGLLGMAANHDLRPRIGLALPLSRAGEALATLERGGVAGKAVIIPD